MSLPLQTRLWTTTQRWNTRTNLGQFLLELKRQGENFLKDNSTNTRPHQQRTITIFFGSITPFPIKSQSRKTRERFQTSKGIRMDWVIAIGHHIDHHQLITIVIYKWSSLSSSRCLPHFRDLSTLRIFIVNNKKEI